MIRAAVPADACALAALWNPWIRDTAVTFNSAEKSEADLLAMIAARDCFLVHVNNGVQGFATYSQFRSGPGYATCMEHSVILLPSARGMGAGRALMVAVEDHARAAGAHQMIAGVSGENPEGQRFHAALGYHEIAIIRDAGFKFGRFIDLVLMQKFLS
ncbi:GNAT family N-acetyltransferase [Cypionkella sp.]|jgi:L-amino acid N-acyltransferase YncA|uniref:GNAT family N-acetyltransferase n=1 Tax=Cypionkella sp. TaxID=2811411 RepID=UPI0027225B35|nr:GNAT family N-acetyltransferase [Cypionkella sp.]MDO8985439.1 N-acetyltransferase family protein [Cypionkella sp.]MDP2048871.1 N-acetyltransferase family protein [Cypionkella sp.]